MAKKPLHPALRENSQKLKRGESLGGKKKSNSSSKKSTLKKK
jgi:hypothetical protein